MGQIYFFEDFEKHNDAMLNPSLLWEYDLSMFDFQIMRNLVVQRVIERGWPNDWYAMLNMYGITDTADAVKAIPYMNEKDMNFASLIFQLPLTEMKCYEKKQSQIQHWHS